MSTTVSIYGKAYEYPDGIDENIYYELMYEFVDLAKVKGTHRKASPEIIY